jgi:zinc transport system substrate-binding protein
MLTKLATAALPFRCTKRLIVLSCAVSLLLAPAALAASQVVATVFPLADVVRQIGGEAVDVHTLLPAGANPHTFEPTPAQLQTIASARLIVRVGAGLDDWITRLLVTANASAPVVAITDGLTLLGPSDSSHGDPHMWLDPLLVRDAIVPALSAKLGGIDPDHATHFAAAAARFGEALTELDREIETRLRPLPQRAFIALHPAWRYFARRYGLEEVAAIEESPGKEPSAQSIARVIEQGRARHVRAVLTEPQMNDRMAQVIAREIGAKVFLVDPLGGPRTAGRDSYLALMRYNAGVFAQALR